MCVRVRCLGWATLSAYPHALGGCPCVPALVCYHIDAHIRSCWNTRLSVLWPFNSKRRRGSNLSPQRRALHLFTQLMSFLSYGALCPHVATLPAKPEPVCRGCGACQAKGDFETKKIRLAKLRGTPGLVEAKLSEAERDVNVAEQQVCGVNIAVKPV